MTFLLDTNVVSELSRRRPASVVVAWLQSLDLGRSYLSVITISEIRRGITLAKDASQQDQLTAWFEDMILAGYRDRILPVDLEVADLSGRIVGRCIRSGRPIEGFDAVIAATAEVHNLTLVTRNTKDFEAWGGPVFNPWIETGPA